MKGCCAPLPPSQDQLPLLAGQPAKRPSRAVTTLCCMGGKGRWRRVKWGGLAS